MPVFKSGKGLSPKWCELEFFEIVNLSSGKKHKFEHTGKKEKIIVGKGQCSITFGGKTITADTGANIDLVTSDGQFEVIAVTSDSTLIRMCGRWGDETGGSGIFEVVKSSAPKDSGDRVDYHKETNFDNHYHDCDEYWIVFEGEGVAVSEGKHYEISSGDCIVTGMGYHHDFPIVYKPIRAVFFETTIEGAKRHGHLWNHTHGNAEPQKERV